ncbi:MAG: NADP-dependent oxidoreductase [Halobacteriaceae archaeon]
MPTTTRVWTLASRPEGEPTPENFEMVDREVRDPSGGEVLLRTLYLSVDPYMRGRMRKPHPYAEPWDLGDPAKADLAGEVVASAHDDYEAGDVVTARADWAEYNVVDGDDLTPVAPDLPVSASLSVVGMPARTAYFGMLDVADPDPGDTVVVSGAAGAVGTVAGQLARLAGARVVGTAGSPEKIEYITEELGYDAGINYRETDDYDAAIEDACPDGVDVYFDNVGGELTDAVWRHLNDFGVVAVCGQIAHYNMAETPTGPRYTDGLFANRARIEGLLVRDWAHRFDEANERLAALVASGEIRYRESVVEGFENAPDAFVGLFAGENVGKQLVKVADRADPV